MSVPTSFRTKRAALAFIFLVAVLEALATGILFTVLPQLILEFVGSNARAGWINGALLALWAGMQFLCAPILCGLSGRYGRRPVVLISCAGLTLDFALLALAPNLWWLALARMVGGAAASSFTALHAYMADIADPDRLGRAYGLVGAALAGGIVLGPVLGGLLAQFGSRTPFWFAAGLSGLALLYGLAFLPESLAADRRTRFSWRRANPTGALVLFWRQGALRGLAVVSFLLRCAHCVILTLFVLYAARSFGWGPLEAGLLLALAGLIGLGVRGAGAGWLVRRLGERATMVLGLSGGAAGLALLGWAPNRWAFAAALLSYALSAVIEPVVGAIMRRRLRGPEQAQLKEADKSLRTLAAVASPLAFGWIYLASAGWGGDVDRGGMAFFIAAGILGGAAVVGAIVARRWEHGQSGAV